MFARKFSRSVSAAMMLGAAMLLAACGDGGGESGAVPASGRQTTGGGPVTLPDTGIGTAMLSWMPPLQNTDGSQLLDLVAYRVLYGRSMYALDRVVTVTNPSVSTYLVEGLGEGTWYFAVEAVNSRGIASALSNIASKTITAR